MDVATPWVKASTDAVTAPAWMVWDEPIAKAASTVAATSRAGTASVRRCAGKSSPAPNKAALGANPRRVSRRLSKSRPRAIRLRTVPTGQRSSLAAWS